MNPIVGLDEVLAGAFEKGMFGTKMRSVIKLANRDGIEAIVDQQFDIGQQIQSKGLVPIIEPEVDIHSPEKAQAEMLLKTAILERFGPGGYCRHEVNAKLACNIDMIASFSRALVEGLSIGQSDDAFDATLDASLAGI